MPCANVCIFLIVHTFIDADSPQHEEKISGSLLANHDSSDQFDQLNNSEDKAQPLRYIRYTILDRTKLHKN